MASRYAPCLHEGCLWKRTRPAPTTCQHRPLFNGNVCCMVLYLLYLYWQLTISVPSLSSGDYEGSPDENANIRQLSNHPDPIIISNHIISLSLSLWCIMIICRKASYLSNKKDPELDMISNHRHTLWDNAWWSFLMSSKMSKLSKCRVEAVALGCFEGWAITFNGLSAATDLPLKPKPHKVICSAWTLPWICAQLSTCISG